MLLAGERKKSEMIELINATAIGSQGDKKAIEKVIKDLKPL